MTLPHENIILGNERIEEIKEDGKIVKDDDFGLVFLKRDDNNPSRFAFVISSKISKLAVHRNRIKRSMHEGVRRNLRDIPKGYDFVFLAKKSLENKTTEEIIEKLNYFFSRLKLDL